jgi:hypothetical protein
MDGEKLQTVNRTSAPFSFVAGAVSDYLCAGRSEQIEFRQQKFLIFEKRAKYRRIFYYGI